MKNFVIILAGGVGSRVGGPMPKQFLPLNDKPVIIHTINNFELNENIDGIVIVCIKEWIPYLKEMHTRGIMSHTEKHFKLRDYKKTWWLKADMSEQKNKLNEEKLFQVIDDDPRLADAVEVEKTIDTDIEKLFTVVGTSDEKI